MLFLIIMLLFYLLMLLFSGDEHKHLIYILHEWLHDVTHILFVYLLPPKLDSTQRLVCWQACHGLNRIQHIFSDHNNPFLEKPDEPCYLEP